MTTLTERAEYGRSALIVCDNLVRIFQVENIEVLALQGLDLLVDEGEMIAIVGASGSGKSTLLSILSGLDTPTAGRARVGSWDLLQLSAADRLAYRRETVGFVWQQTARNLLPYLSAAENVALPMAYAGVRARTRTRRARDILHSLGLGAKADRRPGELSGGEQQRVAIGVALANRPQVLLADEPTGELDARTGEEVFTALRSANENFGTTVVIVTHDAEVAGQVQRTVAIRDGRTASEVARRTETNEHGATRVVAEEFALLDRAGRLQLPNGYRSALGLGSRVRLELEPDHLGVWPVAPPPESGSAPAAASPTAAEAEAPRPPARPAARRARRAR
ncbi:ABC transporter [Subtercola sp. Z020]|uniref:ABC transporter ATP-binding protein n=1 Tax=Subtercola sp. Z020 TaxID=2080582 RepID=UPI000CE928A1|nr:ABC transporter ATP-binding protein [Subtercola sp. Z020]PPF89572.1 ABC transporter [Subtercola sp. Z020]